MMLSWWFTFRHFGPFRFTFRYEVLALLNTCKHQCGSGVSPLTLCPCVAGSAVRVRGCGDLQLADARSGEGQAPCRHPGRGGSGHAGRHQAAEENGEGDRGAGRSGLLGTDLPPLYSAAQEAWAGGQGSHRARPGRGEGRHPGQYRPPQTHRHRAQNRRAADGLHDLRPRQPTRPPAGRPRVSSDDNAVMPTHGVNRRTLGTWFGRLLILGYWPTMRSKPTWGVTLVFLLGTAENKDNVKKLLFECLKERTRRGSKGKDDRMQRNVPLQD